MIKKYLLFAFLILSVIFDQIIKNIILSSPVYLSLWGDFLNINLTINKEIFGGIPFIFSEFVVIFTLVLFIIYIKKTKSNYLFPYFLIALFGAISNLIDRIRLGFVIDYINIFNFSHFNIADLFIYIGVVLIILQIIKKPKLQNTNNKQTTNPNNQKNNL